MDTLLLIDGNAIMHRAYHAIPPFKTKDGKPTNALYGFISILNKAILDFKPFYLIVCFDTPVPTFRKKMFREYQSHRPKMEDNLSSQFPLVKEALDSAHVTHIEKEGFEADDVIGTISRKFDGNKNRVLILSGDRDILQLVNENVYVITPQLGFSKQVVYTIEEVEKRFGIKPDKIPDFKALTGDPSDNYKGAKGIGPKTASKLLHEFHSVDNVLKNIDKIEGKIKGILEVSKESVLISHQLATIITNVDISLTIKNTAFTGFNEQLKDFLIKYEMYALSNRIFKITTNKKPNPNKKSEIKNKTNENQIGLF